MQATCISFPSPFNSKQNFMSEVERPDGGGRFLLARDWEKDKELTEDSQIFISDIKSEFSEGICSVDVIDPLAI